MKLRPFIHFIFGILALVALIWIAVTLLSTPLKNAEIRRSEALKSSLQTQLEGYRSAQGQYPRSLTELKFTNALEEIPERHDLQNCAYRPADSGYELSHTGRWYQWTLLVSNYGASIEWTLSAR